MSSSELRAQLRRPRLACEPGWNGAGLWWKGVGEGRCGPEVLDQGHDGALGLGVAFNVALRGLNRAVSGQELHVAQAPARDRQLAGRLGDKGAPARV